MLQKKLILFIAFLFTHSPSNTQPLIISTSSVFAPSHLGKVEIQHNEDGFSVMQDGCTHQVSSYDVDPILRNVTPVQLAAFLKCGYLSVNQRGNDFALKANVRGLGGGAGGATAGFWIGRGLVYGLSYGTIGVVSLFSGPMAPATFAALSATFAPAIEGAAQVGQLAGGIMGGVATGPV